MEKNISNKKFKITIVSLCLGFLMVVGAIIGVWAASTQTYEAGFKVSYNVGENVAASVRSEHNVPNSGVGVQIAKENSDGEVVTDDNGYITFNSADTAGKKGVDFGEIKLTPQTPSVEFYFTVKNLLSESYLQVVIGKNYKTIENINVKTYYYNTNTFSLTNSATTIAEEDWKTNTQINNATPSGYKMIKVVVSVDDVNSSAEIDGAFTLSLAYSETATNASSFSRSKCNSYINSAYESSNYEAFVFDYAQNNASYKTTGTDLSEAGDGSIWAYAENGTTYVLSNNTISLPQDCSQLFDFNVRNVDMSYMQSGVGNFLHKIVFDNIDTSCVTDMSRMFYNCTSLTSLDVSGFDTSSVITMIYIFRNCTSLTSLDVSGFDTSSVTNMLNMFYNCTNLTSLDVSSFDTSSVTNMQYMFSGCSGLTSLDVSGFDTSSVTNMQYMFSGCSVLTSLDVSGFDTSSVTNMLNMFSGCSGLKTIYASELWSTAKVTSSTNMFSGCSNLVGSGGSVSYDGSKTTHTMANYTTGYLTYKAAPQAN